MTAPEWRVLVLGPPRTKKNHGRIVQVGRKCPVCKRGTPKHLPSEQWTAWAASATVRRLSPQPWTAPRVEVNCAATFYRDARRGDAVGYYQGLADLLEQRGIVEDDKQIVSWDGSRVLVDPTNPRVDLTLTPVAA